MAVDKWFLDEALLGLNFKMFGSQEEVFEYVSTSTKSIRNGMIQMFH